MNWRYKAWERETEQSIYDSAIAGRKASQYVCDILIEVGKKCNHIYYEDMPLPFDYVDSLFPNKNIKELSILSLSRSKIKNIYQELYKRMGYGDKKLPFAAAGFYNISSKSIVVANDCVRKEKLFLGKNGNLSVQGAMEIDEIMVHEMLHYCYFDEGMSNSSKVLEEEFAYGMSLEYLFKKNRGTEDIIDKYLPFFFSSLNIDVFVEALNNLNIKEKFFKVNNKSVIFNKKKFELYRQSVELAIKQVLFDKVERFIEIYMENIQIQKLNNCEKHDQKTGRLGLIDF